jgi:N-acetylneuraminate synthase
MIENYKSPIVVAEIGCNHKGDMDIAKELIDLAKQSGANYAKFQKRHSKELLTAEQYAAPHPNAHNSYGDTYGAHREFLELDQAQNKELLEYCKSVGIGYATSVWDMTSAREIIALQPDYIKIPSACNNHMEMLELLCDEYSGDIHISFGMTTQEEEKKIVGLFERKGVAKDRLVIYACTSGYPVPFEDVCLLEINRLRKTYGDVVKEIAFSGHHLGIAVDIAAYTLGATWVERHFTKDRTWKGTDHAASLEVPGMSSLVRNLKATHKSLTYKPSEILSIEKPQRDKLKYRKH